MKTLLAVFTDYKYIFFVLSITLLATLPLFHAGLPPTHDGEYHLIRFYEFDKILREGNWYPRWAPDLNFGFGIPLLTYIYPLPNYVASLFHLLGASFLDSVKLNMIAATTCGAIFFYLWTKRFWGNLGGLVSSTFYTFAPYHFVDMYVRGSVGEVWALGVFPAFLWSYTEFVQTKKLSYGILSIIFLALTVFSHNILGLMFFTFALGYIGLFFFVSKNKKFFVLSTLFIIVSSLGLSSVFWLPALFETQYVTGLQVFNISRNFPDMFQLLFPSWGTGFFDSNLGDEMSVQIGLANLFAVLLGVVSLFIFTRKREKQTMFIFFFLIWFAVLFFLMLSISLPIWQHVPLIHYFQFPWRLLSLMILVCSFLAGSIVFIKKSKILTGILIAIAIFTTYSYTKPAYYMLRDDSYYITRSNFIDSTNSPGNSFNTIWNTPKSHRPTELFILHDDRQIPELKVFSSTTFILRLTNTSPVEQVMNISYFPSWQVLLDGKKASAYPNPDGLLTFQVPSGQHSIHIALLTTPLEDMATILTLTTALVLFAIFILRRKISTLL